MLEAPTGNCGGRPDQRRSSVWSREDQCIADRDEHADEHVASHERIANAARQQSAPSDHGFRPDAAHVRFERDIQQPRERRDEEDKRRALC